MNGIGEVYTYRKQEKVNKGYGFYDPSKVFTKPDVNGKVKVDGVLSSICKENEAPKDHITIGGKIYHFVTIGTQTWLTRNLEYKFRDSGIWYYNNDESYGEKYGLLYNYDSVTYLIEHTNELIPGWHVASQAEWETLITTIGGNTQGSKIKSEDFNGTNETGLTIVGNGNYNNSTNSFSNIDSYGLIWTSTLGIRVNIPRNSNIVIGSGTVGFGMAIRLVKDSD